VLLDPERDKGFREPDAEADRPVDAGMTGRADGDQPFRVVDAAPAVVNVKGLPCPADLAAPPVAVENRIPVTAKRSARVGAGPVADPAEPGDGGSSLPAGAKQRDLGCPGKPLRPGEQRRCESGGRCHFRKTAIDNRP
jgi:hypothetical protein